MDLARTQTHLGWLGIIRLGLVQSALGAIVVLMVSVLNRVMVVELLLPASFPGALVGWHYAVQLSRPHWGYSSDVGGARTPWIIGGMIALALGAIGAAAGTLLITSMPLLGTILEILAFFVIGIGVGAAGTNLLALLAAKSRPSRKSAAAAIVWIMMILGIVISAGATGAMLDPFSLERFVQVTAIVSVTAVSITIFALWGLEKSLTTDAPTAPKAASPQGGFKAAFAEIWGETQARRFTIFIFISMLAYSAQDLILEPFAGQVYDYTVGQSTSLTGTQHQGVLLGMIITAIIGTTIGKSRASFMRKWTVFGCLASAVALGALCAAAIVGPTWPLKPTVFALGLSNGAFTVAAIGSMMTLASAGAEGREGTRMGLWGASQAIAFGIGGFMGTVILDISRIFLNDIGSPFAIVFGVEGLLFICAAICAMWVGKSSADDTMLPMMPSAELVPAE